MKSLAVTTAIAGIVTGIFYWPNLGWSITCLITGAVLFIAAGAIRAIGERADCQVGNIVYIAEERAQRRPTDPHYRDDDLLAIWDAANGNDE